MKYANDRAHAIALFRQWARAEVKQSGPARTHRELRMAMDALLEEFRKEFEVPGVQYFEHAESGAFYTTCPQDYFLTDPDFIISIELQRHEFLSRQAIYFEDDGL